MVEPTATGLVVQADERLAGRIRALSRRRMVFFAGLPGTGKSLLVHQLAHLAAATGRRIHLLQWDVARPVFEISPAGRRYPLVDGVTHPLIRKAAGLWVRRALARWSERHPDPTHLLIGETPLVGHRFVELAHHLPDEAEALLAAPSCRFVIAAPSAAVRRFLERERERRSAHPLHPREREDAPPRVLRELWDDLVRVARQLGGPGVGQDSVPYDPVVYARVYETVLRHRHVEVVGLDVILPTGRLSAYDFTVEATDLVPTEAEAAEFIHRVERLAGDAAALAREVAGWWQIPGTPLRPPPPPGS